MDAAPDQALGRPLPVLGPAWGRQERREELVTRYLACLVCEAGRAVLWGSGAETGRTAGPTWDWGAAGRRAVHSSCAHSNFQHNTCPTRLPFWVWS